MRVFLTGASGFIGLRVQAKLAERGHSVFQLRARLDDVAAVRAELEAAQPDAVIDLAWEGIPDLSKELSARNQKQHIGFLQMLDDMRVGKVIGIGSSYQRPGVDPGNHGDFIAAKNAVRDTGHELITKNGSVFVWVYPFFVYGPGKRSGSLIPTLIKDAREGKVPAAKNSDAWHDFVYVDDVAEAIVLLTEKETASGDFDIGSGVLSRTGDIANIVAKSFGMPEAALTPSKPHGVAADIAPLWRSASWKPSTSIEQGIQSLV